MYVYDERCTYIPYYIIHIVTGKLKEGLSSYWRCAIKTIPETGANRSGGLKPIVVYVRVCETFRFWWLAGSIFHRLRVSFKDHRRDPFPCSCPYTFCYSSFSSPYSLHPIIDYDTLVADHPLQPPNTMKLINDATSPSYGINPVPSIHVTWFENYTNKVTDRWTKHNNTR